MWYPHSWEELEGKLGSMSESRQLDIKRELPGGSKTRDIAKDVAAMSVAGGVILIGVDEENGVASKITPVRIEGLPERIQQLVQSHVDPPIEFDIKSLRQNQGDPDGVVMLLVPQSIKGPHSYDGRFPTRAGSTTRNLTAAEVQELIAGRQQPDVPKSTGMDEFVLPPGAETGGYVGIGRMRTYVGPAVPARHPDQPDLARALEQASRAAADRMGSLLKPQFSPPAVDWLLNWKTQSSLGWMAGKASHDFQTMSRHKLSAALFRYEGGFSFYSTLGLTPEGQQWLCTYEPLWAAEVMGVLSIAGNFFLDFVETDLRVNLELDGLAGSVSSYATHGEIDSPTAPRVTDSLYEAEGTFSAEELATDPRPAAKELLEPLLITIVDPGVDIVARISV